MEMGGGFPLWTISKAGGVESLKVGTPERAQSGLQSAVFQASLHNSICEPHHPPMIGPITINGPSMTAQFSNC